MFKYLCCLSVPFFAACSRPDHVTVSTTGCQSPFVDMDESRASAEDRQIIREASEDFCAVIAGKDPIHAQVAPGVDLPSDGGTRFYVGRKYELTVLSSASSFGGYAGTAYGPIIKFDASFAPGNTSEISYIRVRGIQWAPDGR